MKKAYDYPIAPGTKISMIAEILRLATDKDLGDNTPGSESEWSHNKWRNKYLAKLGAFEFIVAVDDVEATQFSIQQAKEIMDRYEIRK